MEITKKILLDTNAYSALMRGDEAVLSIVQHAEIIGLSVVTLGELISGFSFGKKMQENLKQLNEFLSISRVKIFSIDEATASFYGKIYTFLRHKGKPIPTNDLWIAASTLQHGYKLCSFDAHFKVIDTLLVVTTLAEFLI